jgi:hypothetical protein
MINEEDSKTVPTSIPRKSEKPSGRRSRKDGQQAKEDGGHCHRITRARKAGPGGPVAPQQEWSVRPISGRTLLSPRPAKYQRSKVSE